MENSNKETQQDKGKRNGCLAVLAKMFVAGIAVVVILAAVFIMPLPFSRTMWDSNDDVRWRMYGSVSRRVIGLSFDEVQEILGTPLNLGFNSGRLSISYPLPRPGQQWMNIIIIFNEDGVVESVWSGNPAHFGLGG